jgi:hypothetical protein
MISKRTYKILKYINKLGNKAEYDKIVNKLSIQNKIFDLNEYYEYSKMGYFEKKSLNCPIITISSIARAEMESYKDDKMSKILLPSIAIGISIISLGVAIWALFK